MKGDPIPETDTVSRYCPFGRLSEAGRPTIAAFQMRDSDLVGTNPHLSVNWLEYFRDKSRDEQIAEIREVFVRKMQRVGGQAKFALAKVSEIHEKVKEVGREVRILHWPVVEDNDDSHAGIFDIDNDFDVIAQALSRMNFEMVAAKAE
jgi:hypothetical protein